MKKSIILISTLIAVATLYLARHLTDPFWVSYWTSIAAGMATLIVGLIFVNIYLEKDSRKGAVKSLLILADSSISQMHNEWLRLSWSKFGRDETGKIFKEYVTSNGQPAALKFSVCESIYDIYTANPILNQHISDLDESLVELSRLAGWSLDPGVLKGCLDARISIRRLRSIKLDGSNPSKLAVTEHLLDIDHHTAAARISLCNLAGIPSSDTVED